MPFALKNITDVPTVVIDQVTAAFLASKSNDWNQKLRWKKDLMASKVWDERKVQMINNLLNQIEATKVSIFRPMGNFQNFYMSYKKLDLSLLKLKHSEYDKAKDEYYNMLDIFMSSGIVPSISMDKELLKRKNGEDV